MMKPGLGFRAGFLEEVIPELKLVGVHSAGGKWQGEGRTYVSWGGWAGNLRRATWLG